MIKAKDGCYLEYEHLEMSMLIWEVNIVSKERRIVGRVSFGC